MNNILILGLVGILAMKGFAAQNGMDEMWGEGTIKLRAENAQRVVPTKTSP